MTGINVLCAMLDGNYLTRHCQCHLRYTGMIFMEKPHELTETF